MKLFRNSISLMLLVTLLLMGISFSESNGTIFDDVATDSWYYEGVTTMAEYGIITGYPDGSFRPMNRVSREEFAVMMVRALKLGKSGSDSSFEDIKGDYWAVPFIEAAKLYLTGYKTSSGVAFKPKADAVREDMAVALVKALEYRVSSADLSVLKDFKDEILISENLRPYVALAYEKGLINGATEDDGLYFHPTKTLTRAEAAVLLLAVIREEKIAFDDSQEKIVFDDNDYKATKLKVEVKGDTAFLKWDKIKHKDFESYKLVVSRYDSTPSYPTNGALRSFDEREVTRFQVRKGQEVAESDFVKIEPGVQYYVAITTVYTEGKRTSNAISFKIENSPEPEYIRPSLNIENKGNEAELKWTRVKHPNFKYYKVVVSQNDKTPEYPENGYMFVISNPDEKDIDIHLGDEASESDFGKIVANQLYYISITAVYEDKKITSNVVEMLLTGDEDEVDDIDEDDDFDADDDFDDDDYDDESYVKPILNIEIQDSRVKLNWTRVNHSDFEGYKVVVSKNNTSPSYPVDGYMKYITDKESNSYVIELGDAPNNGDFDRIEKNVTYHVSITVIYDDKRVTSLPVTFTIRE